MTRILHVTLHLSLDAELSAHPCWQPVLVVSGEKRRFIENHGDEAMGDSERVQRYLSLDENNPASIVSTIAAARENARTIREVIRLERHRGRVSGPSVAAFLILEPLFPRSVRHAVNASQRRLQSVCPPTTVLDNGPLNVSTPLVKPLPHAILMQCPRRTTSLRLS
jgi:uncharacterized alpha-E superfamily protein